MLTAKIGAGIALTAALVLGASPALGASWTVVSAPPTGHNAQLMGVSAPSDTSAWAVGAENGAINTGLGSHALIDHWNGTAWSQATVPALTGTVSLAGVSSSGANDAWAVGTQRPQRYSFTPLALHWNGTAWATSPSVYAALGGGTYLVGTADISPTDAYAIGDNTSAASGEFAQWNGTAWSIVPSPSPGTNDALTGVTESAPNNLWAVGYGTPAGASSAQTLTLNWNGIAWTTVASPNQGSPSVLNSVSTTPGDAIVWAAGYSGTTGSFNPLILQNG